jgi:hypothetical protein
MGTNSEHEWLHDRGEHLKSVRLDGRRKVSRRKPNGRQAQEHGDKLKLDEEMPVRPLDRAHSSACSFTEAHSQVDR